MVLITPKLDTGAEKTTTKALLPPITQENKRQSIDPYHLVNLPCGCFSLHRKDALHFSVNSWSSILADLINVLRLAVVVFRPYVAVFLMALAIMG